MNLGIFIPTNTFKPVQKAQNFITGLQNIFKCLGDLWFARYY